MRMGLQEILVFGLLLGVLGGAYQVGFKRLGEQQKAIQQQIRDKQAVLDMIAASGRRAGQLDVEVAKLRSDIDLFDQRIPKTKSEYAVQQDLARIAAKCNVSITSTRPLNVVKGPRCHELPMEVLFTGDFASFYDFLREVESLERITRIHQMQLGRGDDPTKPTTGKVTISIFYEPEAVASAGQ
ncbi:MAG: type 4a pilus biogenesis protein PilO [Tepidisphaeraceae bacterium]